MIYFLCVAHFRGIPRRFPFKQNFRNFRNEGKWYGDISLAKCLNNPKIVDGDVPFANDNFWKFTPNFWTNGKRSKSTTRIPIIIKT